MKCPNCVAVDLLMSDRQGVEIDYCPSCRGVWLDRGELDKFIERANSTSSFPTQEGSSSKDHRVFDSYPLNRSHDDDDDHRYRDADFRRGDERGHPPRGKKKESFWSNLFDFD